MVLPILNAAMFEAELPGELALREPKVLADRFHVDVVGHVGDKVSPVFTTCILHRLACTLKNTLP